MFDKIFLLIKLIFSRTPDKSTASGRSHDRYRRAARTSLISLVARIVNISVGLVIVPITLSYLGPDRYGLWMALTSFVAFLAFSDMGLGIGLQNALSECYGKDDRINPRSYISSAMLITGLVFMLFVALALVALPQISLDRLFKIESEIARSELLPTAQAVLIIFGFGLPTGLIQRIYNSYQQGYWANLYLALGRITGLGGVVLCIWFELGLPSLVASLMGMPFICLAFGGIILFRKQVWLRPSFLTITQKSLRRIFKIGFVAVVAQIAYAIIQSGPALIIANRLGTAVITPLAVTQKLLGVTAILLMTAVLPLWPAYSEAAARGDWDWVKRTFRRTIFLVTGIFIPIFVIMAVFGRQIIQLWTQDASAVPNWSLLMACNVWCVLRAWNTIACMLLNGLNHLVGQATYGLVFAIIAMGAGYWVAPTYGVNGVIWTVVLIGALLRGIAMALEVTWVIRVREKAAKQL